MTDSEKKIEQTPDGGIKLPVRYDDKQRVLRHGDFGLILVEFPYSFATSDAHVAEDDNRCRTRGEYIAKCINEYPALLSELRRKTEALEHYANPKNWSQSHDCTDDYCVWAQHSDGYEIAQAALKPVD